MRMKQLTLSKIAEVTGGKLIGPDSCKEQAITGVVRDNRQVSHGNLFVCIKGERSDGHDFAGKAYEAGAACCLAECMPESAGNNPYVLVKSTLQALKDLARYYRGLFNIPIIGVIGSVGKTTAKEMVWSVLSQKYEVLKTPENLNNEIGVPLTLLSLRQEHTAAVVEMGISDFGEMSRLADMVRPDICLMTAIGYCHLENLIDLDGVLRAKSEVFSFMDKSRGIAVVNGDDKKLASLNCGMKKITFGFWGGNDYVASEVENMGFDGVTCRIRGGDTDIKVCIPAYGSHVVLAALPAVAIGHKLGLEDGEIVRGIAQFATVGGRANVIDTGFLKIIDDCYNANPNSVSSSITSLSSLEGRKVAVLGDMRELGADAEMLHYNVGVLAANLGVDRLICCGKMAQHIYDGYISLCKKREAAWYFSEKEDALPVLPLLVQAGDTVLVKASHSMHFEEIVEELKKLI